MNGGRPLARINRSEQCLASCYLCWCAKALHVNSRACSRRVSPVEEKLAGSELGRLGQREKLPATYAKLIRSCSGLRELEKLPPRAKLTYNGAELTKGPKYTSAIPQ